MHELELTACGVVDIKSELAREEGRECEVLVVEVKVQTHGQVRVRVTNDAAVGIVDHTVTIDIAEDETAYALALLDGMVGNLILILEDAVAYITVVDTHGLSYHQAVVATLRGHHVVELHQFVLILRDIECTVPREVAILR